MTVKKIGGTRSGKTLEIARKIDSQKDPDLSSREKTALEYLKGETRDD